MGLLKKILPVASALLISTSAYAIDKGDRLPNFSHLEPIHYPLWSNEEQTIFGDSLHYDLNNDGEQDFTIARRYCKGFKVIFGMYDWKNEVLYLDKNGNGLIDEINKNIKGTPIHKKAPSCSRGI